MELKRLGCLLENLQRRRQQRRKKMRIARRLREETAMPPVANAPTARMENTERSTANAESWMEG